MLHAGAARRELVAELVGGVYEADRERVAVGQER
jgi:hypothetical protein